MPFKSQAQRGLFYAKMKRGEMDPSVVQEFEDATPKGKKLPKHVKKKGHMKKAFVESFHKTAGIKDTARAVGDKAKKAWQDAPALDKAGLGLLAVAPAVHTYKAVKNKDKGEAALGASELGGLGLLYRSVNKAH